MQKGNVDYLKVAISTLAVVVGVALTFYARFRFISNRPEESPFAGRRWTPLPGPSRFRRPGFALLLAGLALSAAGLVIG
jgi:hypothetical protein